ncbi:MAG: hypothetical protein JWM16_1772 [Verrucomicrobiales bacterium]|nr:hypothetical protein [Verrucomicrobiales bacterium]
MQLVLLYAVLWMDCGVNGRVGLLRVKPNCLEGTVRMKVIQAAVAKEVGVEGLR